MSAAKAALFDSRKIVFCMLMIAFAAIIELNKIEHWFVYSIESPIVLRIHFADDSWLSVVSRVQKKYTRTEKKCLKFTDPLHGSYITLIRHFYTY